MKRLRDDITEISESRQVWSDNPLLGGSKVVGHEYWHHFETPNGSQIGHMIGVVPWTGDFEAHRQAHEKMISEHNQACELRQRFEQPEEA